MSILDYVIDTVYGGLCYYELLILSMLDYVADIVDVGQCC
jgi:hypothetical protein